MMEYEKLSLGEVRPNPKNPRTHSKKQIKQLADSIGASTYFSPIAVDEGNMILAGHARWEAAKLLGLKEVPVIRVLGLSRARKRALILADNRIQEGARWDRKLLAIEFPELTELLAAEGLEIGITGFSPPEIDQIALDFEDSSVDPADELDGFVGTGATVSTLGDLWHLGEHRLLCGDATKPEDLVRLMSGQLVDMLITDPPYNVSVRSVVGRGRTKHAEFAMASGEMSDAEYRTFLSTSLGAAAKLSRPGALHYIFEDWRHIADLIEVSRPVYSAMVNLAVWAKSTAGQGSYYRSQHELIGIFRVGEEPHLNNIELGRHGRSRSNLWSYPGVNTFRRDRMAELRLHPTVKPVNLVVDAIRDCTRRGDKILDIFAGSGTTILAAERIGRRCYALELEPKYVDIAIRRWQAFTGCDAVHAETGRTFEDRGKARDPKNPAVEVAQETGK
jgi:DNA modification methylase